MYGYWKGIATALLAGAAATGIKGDLSDTRENVRSNMCADYAATQLQNVQRFSITNGSGGHTVYMRGRFGTAGSEVAQIIQTDPFTLPTIINYSFWPDKQPGTYKVEIEVTTGLEISSPRFGFSDIELQPDEAFKEQAIRKAEGIALAFRECMQDYGMRMPGAYLAVLSMRAQSGLRGSLSKTGLSQ
jgi:hypothetical protein